MTQSKVYQIGKNDYKKALRHGAHTIIGKHEGKIISADVDQAQDGTYWLAFICEVEDGNI